MMDNRTVVCLSSFLLVAGGVLFIEGGTLTGASTSSLSSYTITLSGSLLLLVSILILVVGLEHVVNAEKLARVAKHHNWLLYPVTSDSVPLDQRVSGGFGYLQNPCHAQIDRINPLQDRIERAVASGEIILPYVREDTDAARNSCKGGCVNRRLTYAEQFNLGGSAEPETFVRQSVAVFKYFAKKSGWRSVRGGPSFS